MRLTPVEKGSPRIITETELLANASDVEEDALSVNSVTISSGNGILIDNGDGTWTYTPAADDDSEVVFSYNVSDGTDDVAGSATLDILPFNEAPTITSVTLTAVQEDSDRIITEAELLANASDIEGDVLSVNDVAIASGNGSLVDNGDGTWTYTPSSNDDTDVSFSYTVTDGPNDVVGTATLDIVSVNDAPVFERLTEDLEVAPDQTFVVELVATDVEGDEISYRLGDANDERFFEIDQATGSLQFVDTPDFALLGVAGESTLLVEVIAQDALRADSERKLVSVSIPEFAVPPRRMVDANSGDDSPVDSDEQGDGEILGIDVSTLPSAGSLPGQLDEAIVGPQPNVGGESSDDVGVDDFDYAGELFVVASVGADVDLGFFESYYKGADFIQETELVSQQLADVYGARRNVESVQADDGKLAALFWQQLDYSNEDYLQRNFDADNAKIVAASAGLFSAGLLFAVYGGSIAITTLATQLPAWKSLDISPLISAFDEDEESIHEIVDG